MNSLEYKYIKGYNNKYYITKEGKVYISNYRNTGVAKEMNVRKKHRWEEDKKLPLKYLEYLKELKSKYRANYLCNSK